MQIPSVITMTSTSTATLTGGDKTYYGFVFSGGGAMNDVMGLTLLQI